MTGWIDLTGWTLIHFLWQGTLVAAVTTVGLRLLHTARARYALACGALATMLALPVATVWQLSIDTRTAVAAVSRAGTPAVLTERTASGNHSPIATDDTALPSASAGAAEPLSGGTTPFMPSLVTVWLAGVLLLLLRLAGGYWRIRHLQRDAFLEPASRWQAAADTIARRLRLRRPVFMVDSSRVDTPTVIGWLRPVILLPVAAMTSLAPAQIDAILAHELAHIRRHDFLVNLLQTFAETMLFYHPAVWWISARIRTEREHCCDDVAVDVCGDPVAYAAALTELAAWTLQQRPLAMAATSGPLLSRVRRLLGLSGPARPSSGLLIGGLALTLVLVAGSVRAISLAQVSAQARADTDDRGFGPPEINRLVGYELFPGPKTWPTEDPRDATAWHVTVDFTNGSMPLIGFTGRSIIRQAYGLSAEPIVDAPAWLDTQSFDLSAPADVSLADGARDPDAMQASLRTMLEQQLGLVVHHEQREFPVYALVKANADGRLGPQIRLSTSDCWDASGPRPPQFSGFCGVDNHLTGSTGVRVTMAEFVDEAVGQIRHSPLGPELEVVDRTGLTGEYDFSIRYGFIPFAAIGAAHYRLGRLLEPLGFRSLFTALPEQLGLKLERSTATFDVLVIDRIQKPAS